jgi:hypothetical protein
VNSLSGKKRVKKTRKNTHRITASKRVQNQSQHTPNKELLKICCDLSILSMKILTTTPQKTAAEVLSKKHTMSFCT